MLVIKKDGTLPVCTCTYQNNFNWLKEDFNEFINIMKERNQSEFIYRCPSEYLDMPIDVELKNKELVKCDDLVIMPALEKLWVYKLKIDTAKKQTDNDKDETIINGSVWYT